MALQIGKAACVLENVKECVRRILFHLVFFKKKTVYHLNLLGICYHQSTGIVTGMSSFLLFFCYRTTGIVAGMVFPTFVADHGCVSSPPNMMIHLALD